MSLTMRLSTAEDLVLKTMAKAYRTWNGSDDTIDNKAVLFRSLVREFFTGCNRRRRPGRFLNENGRARANGDNGDRLHRATSISKGELLLLTKVSSIDAKGAVARLRPESRLICLLLMREHFSYANIAFITDLEENSLKSFIARLRRLIPRYLLQHADCSAIRVDSHSELRFHGASPNVGRNGG